MVDADLIECLSRLDLLKPVPENQRESLARLLADVSEYFEVGPGETVLQEGHLGFASGFVMLQGDAEVVKDGRSTVTLKSPTLLGEMSQFHGKDTRSASVRTTSDAAFLRFDWAELHERANQELGARKAHLLKAAVERLIWKRFGHNELMNLPLFQGLGDEIAYKVCVVFPWLTEKVILPEGAVLFHSYTRCQSKGHLLVRGKMLLRRDDGRDSTLTAPDIIGVMPKSEPKQTWTATCTAMEESTVLVFSWTQYIALLQERLAAEDQQKVVEAFRANAGAHFQH